MDYQIQFEDGTIINGMTAYVQGFLWCYFTGKTMQETAEIFLDETKTGKIVFISGENRTEYDGFTDCRVIQKDIDGKLSVCLTRGAQNG